MSTIRRQIMTLLFASPQDLRALSQALRISEKEAAGHLPHIEKSLRQQGIKLQSTPYRCRLCGFEFKDRHRFTKPGRCPRCHNGALEPATYRVDAPSRALEPPEDGNGGLF